MIVLPQSRTRDVFRKVVNASMLGLTGLAAAVAVSAFLIVLGYILVGGGANLSGAMFTKGPTPMGTPGGGLRNAIVGSLVLIAVASAIGVPLGILGGIYQVEAKNKFAEALRFATDVLNSIPSIVIGLFVYTVVVIPVAKAHPGHGFSAFAGGVAMSIIMIPIVMRTTEQILRMVPVSVREASLALGAGHARTMFKVVLPAAKSGILTGVMLAVARVAGETAPLLFTAFGNLIFSVRLDKPIDSLPLSIFTNATSPYDYLHKLAMTGSLILVLLILVFSILTRFALRSKVLEER